MRRFARTHGAPRRLRRTLATVAAGLLSVPFSNDAAAQAYPDFEPVTAQGWYAPVVVSPLNNISGASATTPTFLLGGQTSYFGFAGINSGMATHVSPHTRVKVSDRSIFSDHIYVDTQAQTWAGISATIPGGRHTLWVKFDDDEQVPETDETNNGWGAQWVWQPPIVPGAQRLEQPRPPAADAGHEHLPAGVTAWDNVHGVRIMPQGGDWLAVAMSIEDATSDFDLSLYAPSQGLTDGFTVPLASSRAGAGLTEVIVAHAALVGQVLYDVGATNPAGDFGDHALEVRRESEVYTPWTDIPRAFPAGQMVLVDVFTVGAGEGDAAMVEVLIDPQDPPLHLAVLGPDFTVGPATDGLGHDTTDVHGRARVVVPTVAGEAYGLVVWRDGWPGDGPAEHQLRILPAMPDLAAIPRPGSVSAAMPTNDGSIVPGAPVPVPDMLPGDVMGTYFHCHWANIGAVQASFRMLLELDGGTWNGIGEMQGGPGDPDRFFTHRVNTSVRGGRHTVNLYLDWEEAVAEWDEVNNRGGAQWVWTPAPLVAGQAVQRSAPGLRDGGWSSVIGGVPLFDNVDGARTPVFTAGPDAGEWAAVAILPTGASDLDLRLHAPAGSATQGFDAILAESGWAGSVSEVVLMDLAAYPEGAVWDAGVLRYSGESPYLIQSVQARPLGEGAIPLPSDHGPFTLAGGKVLELFEFTTGAHVPATEVEITIAALAGQADVVAGLYRRDQENPLQSRSRAIAWADAGAGGEGETLVATLTPSTSYAVAVAKQDAGDAAQQLQFELLFRGDSAVGVTDDPELPTRSRLESVYPNPFNPQTTVKLAMGRPGRAVVKVYDVQGKLVRTLADGHLAAGRHELRWNGSDDAGRPVASGVYLVRAIHPDGEDRRRLTMVK